MKMQNRRSETRYHDCYEKYCYKLKSLGIEPFNEHNFNITVDIIKRNQVWALNEYDATEYIISSVTAELA